MMILTNRLSFFFCSNLSKKNKQFLKKVNTYHKDLSIHSKTRDVKQTQINEWALNQNKTQLADKIVKESEYDITVKNFISKFNKDHKGQINLLDFSNYATEFGKLKDVPISKEDMDVIQEFQKRSIDKKLHSLKKSKIKQEIDPEMRQFEGNAQTDWRVQNTSPLGTENRDIEYENDKDEFDYDDSENVLTFTGITESMDSGQDKQGPFEIEDNFVMILLNRSTTTKITTLNRLNFFKSLVFMGNGNGVISYGSARQVSAEAALKKAIDNCKKNIIAIAMDERLTLPEKINSRFQDYHVYLRPIPGFNPQGNPVFATMLALTGHSHVGFKTVHTGKNMYTLLKSFFKAVTQNTTPQQISEHEGYKVYRHRWIRPLTTESTHKELSR